MLSKEALWAYNREPTIISPVGRNREPNPYFHLNLPYDYAELSPQSRKLARLNGLLLQKTPDHFVRAWNLFRTHYLAQLPDGVFYKGMIDSPKCHFDAVRDLAAYQLNAWAFPRGSGKSTVLGQEIPMLMALTRTNFDELLILAKEKMVQKRFSRFMFQFEENKFITSDFGGMKPPRGAKVWNHHLMQFMNGSSMMGMPVEGKMLGERPDLILPDDPEHDKAMVTNPNPSLLLEAFERLLFGTLMPMMREGSCLGWIGTLLDMRSFLYYVMHSNDPKFNYWNRRVLAGMDEDGSSIWPERWSAEDLQELRKMWGEDYFQTHMQNRPGGRSKAVLKMHQEFCQYTVEDEDDAFGVKPFESRAKLVTMRPTVRDPEHNDEYSSERTERPYGEVVGSMYRMMTVDFAFTTGRRSDFSCCHVMGFENSSVFKDTLWSLDMWLGKRSPAEFIQVVLAMAAKWKVRLIAVEAVGIQQQLVDQIAAGVDIPGYSSNWKPQVVALRFPSNLDKGQRIAGLEWRFNKFRVKLPAHRRDAWPYRELYRQIENFTVDLKRLTHDDAIDTLAMHQFVGRPRAGGMGDPGEPDMSPVAHLKRGEFTDKAGIPYICGLSPEEVPLEDLLLHHARAAENEEIVHWKSPSQI